MNILVTGAAGYIGSVLTEELVKEKYSVIALDTLERGHIEAVHPSAIFIQVDINDESKLADVFSKYKIDTVMHLAAAIQVPESIVNPEKYFRYNVLYPLSMLRVMLKFDVKRMIFSSTAAVYGNPVGIPVKENDPTIPVNPYGESKLMFENILKWYAQAYDLSYIALRYFNAAGASQNYGCDHENETLLIPNLLRVALGQIESVNIFGTDYETDDGTCIRDYIDVRDLARAHIMSMKYLEHGRTARVYNLGNGKGYSVLEVLKVARKVTGHAIPSVEFPRRAGDPPRLVASSQLAKVELGWEPVYNTLESIIESAWNWQKKHPNGYRG